MRVLGRALLQFSNMGHCELGWLLGRVSTHKTCAQRTGGELHAAQHGRSTMTNIAIAALCMPPHTHTMTRPI